MPPEYVTQYLPVELLAVVAAVAAVWWGVSMVAKFVGRIRSTVRPWIEWLETFRSDWEGRPERTTPDGYVLHPAEPGVPQRLAVSDERIEGLTAAIAEHSEAIAEIRYNVKGNSGHSAWDAMAEKLDTNTKLLHELRGIVHQVAMRQSTQSNDLQSLRESHLRALEHNHPDYTPEA